ncbi:MAG: biotin carboxylase N-terminal domain-containing protein [Gammaproteobacteria bacterium]
MLESVLIANRGEIARRIIRTAKRLGVRTIALHSDVDSAMPFVREADEAVCIGTAPARESYLAQEKVLAAALRAGAAAIHPGYGFLSENADFAEAVVAAGVVWIGAPAAAIRAMGQKDAAKRLMMDAGVPVTRGYLGEDQSAERLRIEADRIGYPVLVKAVAGGGGKGMRKVDAATGFSDALQSCRREAKASFGDDRVLIETYVERPRHIEVQVFGDTHGQIVHLFERDCSLQRRYQKVIEEAPAPGMTSGVRSAVCAAAVKAARSVSYVGAGTVEFIADASEGLRADRIWFIEMNTRLQVEHPVTEAITGQDLVEWQFRVASGEPLPMLQPQLAIGGCAIEARLYAESPEAGFLPSPGQMKHLRFPVGVRVDSGVEEGGEVSPHYDPMIAKLIAHGPTRDAAAAALAEACANVQAWPVKTNAAFLARALKHPRFLAGDLDTGFIERHLENLVPAATPSEAVLEAAANAMLSVDTDEPWRALKGFRMAGPPERRVRVEIAGRTHVVECAQSASNGAIADMGNTKVLFIAGEAWQFGPERADSGIKGSAGNGAIASPMPGVISAIDVKAGDAVTRGQRLLVVEAMKMEHALVAPFAGIVAALHAEAGQHVAEGALLVRVEPEPEA